MKIEMKVKIKQEADVVGDVSKESGGADESQDEDDCSAKPCKKPLGMLLWLFLHWNAGYSQLQGELYFK